MPHREVHVPEELIEGAETPHDRADRLLELGSVLVLSLAVLLTAWSGYHAARWSGVESREYTQASALYVKSAQHATQGGQERIDDLLYFDGWLDAHGAGNERLAAVYRRRFRPEFRPVFRAWMAQQPFSNPHAVPGPLYMPGYRAASDSRSAEVHEEAEESFENGIEAKEHDDAYILATVFFATVLFFASVSMRLEWRRLRLAMFGLGNVMLLVGVAWLVSLPTA